MYHQFLVWAHFDQYGVLEEVSEHFKNIVTYGWGHNTHIYRLSSGISFSHLFDNTMCQIIKKDRLSVIILRKKKKKKLELYLFFLQVLEI